MVQYRPELIDAGSATLLLGTILLDTVDLEPAAKFNVSVLGTNDLVRKDYKAWETPSGTYGVSTVLTSIEDRIAKDPGLVMGRPLH